MAVMKKNRFKILDVTISYDNFDMSHRFEIRYFDVEHPLNKYNTVVVAGNSYGSPDMYEALESVAISAAQKVGDPEFYHAMYEYVSMNLPYPGTNDYSFAKKAFPKKSVKGDPIFDPGFKPTAAQIKKPKTKKLEPGPDMQEIDALPGIHELAKHPVDASKMEIKDIIISLNDTHGWTREAVADWLETLDVDLRFKTEDDKLREQREKRLADLRAALAKVNDEIVKFASALSEAKVKAKNFDEEIKKLMEAENEQG